MKISRVSMMSRTMNTLDIDVTQEQLDLYEGGRELIQDVFPHISGDEREFIKTGITPDEWTQMVEDDVDEDEEN